MTMTVPNPTDDAEEVERRNPILHMSLHVRLSELDGTDAVATTPYGDPDTGFVALKFGPKGSGDARVTLSGSAYELRRLSVMLDQAAMEIERQWAVAQVDVAVPLQDLPERCDRCNGTDTHNPEGICDECMADLDSPAMDGGGF